MSMISSPAVRSKQDAAELIKQIQGLLKVGGFELRKWATNHPILLRDIPVENHRDSSSNDPFM